MKKCLKLSKKAIAVFLSLLMMFSVSAPSSFAADTDDIVLQAESVTDTLTKDSDGAYLLDSKDELILWSELIKGNVGKARTTNVKLAGDIDLEGISWSPVNNFNANFDGQNHKIKNLYVRTFAANAGFFGLVQPSKAITIKNVEFNNAYVNNGEKADGTSSFLRGAGVLAGQLYSRIVADNIRVTGKIEVIGAQYVAGIAGNASYAKYINCFVDGSNDEGFESYICATAGEDSRGYLMTNYVAGIVGQIGEGGQRVESNTVRNIKIVAAGAGMGGIAGVMQYGSIIQNNTVDNVLLVAAYPDDDMFAWSGSVVGKDYSSVNNKACLLINNTVNYTAFINGIESELKYVGDDNSHTHPDYSKYNQNTVIASNAVFDENGKIVQGDFITIGPNSGQALNDLISSDVELIENGNGSFVMKPEAKIGEIYYSSVSSAISSAKENDVVDLITDCTEDLVVSANKKVTIDLAGHKISGNIDNYGNLTIIDSSKRQNGQVSGVINNNAELKIESGNFKNEINNIDNLGTVTVTGGQFILDGKVNENITAFLKNICFKLDRNGKVIKLHNDNSEYTLVEVVAPNCTELGYTVLKCNNCGILKYTDYVPAEHRKAIIPAVAPTCENEGLSVGVKCEVCGEILAEQKVLPAKGHIDNNEDRVCDECGAKLPTSCTCICHSGNFIGLLVRVYCTILTAILRKPIKCCNDMEFYK